ncbi:1-aminocyclopropane-1-carboxylate deaminase/D-cysteine desulfhydrase [Aeromonas schubertii]|uniref:1-aminocyclopropane-1-carboxylate deaminase/D-cysteine desulfhydrase n=1 Tax=Aeromonas schubertii TaxID=652 RepID=UPI0038B4A94A
MSINYSDQDETFPDCATLGAHLSAIPPSPLERLSHPLFTRAGVEVWVKRDDLLDPLISGNKWRKLKYHLIHARAQGLSTLLSFGGAYSNHLHALAAAGRRFGFATRALVRGEPQAADNATLRQCREWGMTLTFVDRQTYRLRHDPEWLGRLAEPDTLLIPEGGSSPLALAGVAELVGEVPFSPDLWVLPCASGGTTAGLLSGRGSGEQVLAIAVLKGDFLPAEICRLWPAAAESAGWSVTQAHHQGGYARFSPELWHWVEAFSAHTGLPLEPIYSGKGMHGLCRELEAGAIPRGSRIVFIHTGGLQGLAGLREQGRLGSP